ncbi:MAG TPA: 3-isopropylmalate dehydratase small subunit [Burkholderiaceae bacterium]|jgi:3-isopropylmalate/(R)-2-methylmalate dehydratase small subunit|nr:3-isopropylmalate dehydratase small subunit [Burkholderiaceae bacterium]
MRPAPLVTHRGVVAPLALANVDTDAIFPKQYGRSIAASGFGPILFDNWRYLDPGDLDSDHSRRRENPDFVLNREPYRRATVLLARENFGCGSSREHAAWALRDFGFRAIVAPSFASIFAGNALANGLLAIALRASDVDALFAWVRAQALPEVVIDLPGQWLAAGERRFGFDVDARAKQSLLAGWDEIERTLQRRDAIGAFEARRLSEHPWLA